MTAISITRTPHDATAPHGARSSHPRGARGAARRHRAEPRGDQRRQRARVARRRAPRADSFTTLTVAAGDSLWSIAEQVAPGCRSPRRRRRDRAAERSRRRHRLGRPAAVDPGGVLERAVIPVVAERLLAAPASTHGRGEHSPRRPSPSRRPPRHDAVRRAPGGAAGRAEREREHASGSAGGRGRHPGCRRPRAARRQPLPRPRVHRAARGLRRLPRLRADARADLGGERLERSAAARAAGVRRAGTHGVRLRADVLDVPAADARDRRGAGSREPARPTSRSTRRARQRRSPRPRPTSSSCARRTTRPARR